MAHKAILEIIKEVCPVIGLGIPDTVFSSTDREQIELAALANEMAARIAFDTADWTVLKKLATLNGDGVSQGLDLPEDYARMLKQARIFPSSNTSTPLSHYNDADQWLALQVQGFQPTWGGWTLIGEQMMIAPAVPDGGNVKFYYLSNLYAKSAGGDAKPSFTADDDTFRLNDRVLKLGMIMQWKAQKGFAYGEDMENYETALSSQIASDQGSTILTMGSRGVWDAQIAYPWQLGV